MDDRLPNTGFNQFSGMVKANWTPSSRTQIVSTYTATRQDKAHRYDQELGGDGNLISELNDMTLDLFYTRLERHGLGWFDHGAFTYSINSQREERVNQGGQGSSTATIGHEPERTTSNGVPGGAQQVDVAMRASRSAATCSSKSSSSDAFNINPITGARSVRRPRVPSNADVRAGRRVRADGIRRRCRSTAPGRRDPRRAMRPTKRAPPMRRCRAASPLWPDDSFSTTSLTFRAGAIITPGRARGRSSSARAAASALRT